MSFNRNQGQDRFATKQMLKRPTEKEGENNWLGHGAATAAAKMDQMLLDGATFEQLLTSGRKPNSVRSHLHHLKSDHGLAIENYDGVYRFV